MGNCCTAEQQKEVVISQTITGKKPKVQSGYTKGTDEILDFVLDEREVCGLVGEEKVLLVEKI